ncbi:MAG TPA: hypothetical protein VFR34_16050, partial [Paracoccaceae bacterium]|nr:hypothetical protein [Paracoccaceae bacterium]
MASPAAADSAAAARPVEPAGIAGEIAQLGPAPADGGRAPAAPPFAFPLVDEAASGTPARPWDPAEGDYRRVIATVVAEELAGPEGPAGPLLKRP